MALLAASVLSCNDLGGDGVDAHLGSTTQASTGANDAPVLLDKTPTLVPEYNVGTTAPSGIVGTPIGVLVDAATPTGQLDNVNDPDVGEAEPSTGLGIAVTAATTTNGSWFYSTNNGTAWSALGAVTDANARLLAVDGNTRIYFQPNTGFGGTATITFRAWDQATGTNGGTADTSGANNGGTTAFSNTTDTADVTVSAPITLRNVSTTKTNGVASTTFTVAMPTGTVQGDVMIASISSTGTGTPTAVPSGWTLVRSISGSGVGLFIYRKVAGAAEAGPYTWTLGATAQSNAGGIESFYNVDNANPVDVDASATASPSSTITAPSVTPTVSPSMLLTYHSYASSNNWTPPGGMTEAIDVFSDAAAGSTGVAIEGNYQALSSTAATGTRSATAAGNNNDNSAAESLILKPATVLAIPSNSAPVLDSSKSPALAAVAEDAAVPSGAGLGTLVSALVDPASPSGGTDNVSDPDTGAVTGIAITTVDVSCTWYYTLDNATWTPMPAVTATAALLLPADANTRIYCRPNANFSGSIATAVTFRAWDQTTGTAGTTANPGAGGATTAFSSATDTASLTVTGVNDAPVLDNTKTPALQNVAEDAPAPTGAVGTLVSSLVDFATPAGQVDNVTDVDTNPQLGIAITAVDTANLTAYFSLDGGTTWTPMGAVTGASARLLAADSDNRIYVNAGANVSGTFATAITFRAWDQTAGADGSLADTSTNGGATAFSTATDTAGVVVSSVNDTPSVTNINAPQTYTEDMPLDLTDMVVTDDDPSVTATLTLSNPAAGSLSVSGTATYDSLTGVWTVTGTLAQVNAALAATVFTPTANFDQSFTIGVDVNDGTVSATGTKAITATPVNDAPTLDASKSPALLAVSEDAGAPSGAVGTPVSALVDFATPSGQVDNVTDPDTGAVLGIAITATDTANLTAYYSINGGTTWQSLAGVTPGSARLLTTAASNRIYVNAGTNVNGSFPSAITFRAWDVSAGTNDTLADTTTNGGATAFSTATDTASVVVTAVNDPPTATFLSAPETYTEDTALNLVDIVVSDIDSANVTVTLTLSNTAAGTLAATPSTSGGATSSFSNGVWTASGPIAGVNVLLADVTFTPTTNFNSNFNILTSVTDGASSAIVGSKPMTGTAVNDGPSATNINAPETYLEDTALNLTDIVVSDPDNATTTVTLTLSNPAVGSLNTGNSGSVTSTYNPGTGVWTATGAITNVNILLAALTFTPVANSSVSFTMDVVVTDGTASPVMGTKPFTGTAVNDAPTATNMSTNETYVEGSNKDLVDIVVSDVDSNVVTVTLTLSNTAAGSLTTGSSGAATSTYNAGTGVWTVTGLLFNVNTLLSTVNYVPAANFNSTFTIATSVSDGPNTITGSKTLNGVAVNTP
ncbi:MAG TPA: hypothetical protein VL326_00520, partial [Kofleriaceae bacterium]|nr:hypothetical protein [Kofleriaceae bacterium]